MSWAHLAARGVMVPGIVAGPTFAFSLTLGDYIISGAIGNSSFFIGQAVLSHQGTVDTPRAPKRFFQRIEGPLADAQPQPAAGYGAHSSA